MFRRVLTSLLGVDDGVVPADDRRPCGCSLGGTGRYGVRVLIMKAVFRLAVDVITSDGLWTAKLTAAAIVLLVLLVSQAWKCLRRAR